MKTIKYLLLVFLLVILVGCKDKAFMEQYPQLTDKKHIYEVIDATKVLDKLPSADVAEIKPEIPAEEPVERPKKKKRRPAPESVETVKAAETKPEISAEVPVERPKKKKHLD